MACCSELAPEFSDDEVEEVVEDDELVMEEAGDDSADEWGDIVDEALLELVGDIELLMKGTFGKNVCCCCFVVCGELSLLFLVQLSAAEFSLVL